MSIWIIGAYILYRNFPQMRQTWGHEMYKLEQGDIVEYRRFQTGITTFFEFHLNNRKEQGFEKL